MSDGRNGGRGVRLINILGPAAWAIMTAHQNSSVVLASSFGCTAEAIVTGLALRHGSADKPRSDILLRQPNPVLP
ncbi:MAG: hypothetical protein OXC93_03525 [Rhodospirillaceae bacterium]|nr:hypothetical protein [Rhodospirillaceae bacterium]